MLLSLALVDKQPYTPTFPDIVIWDAVEVYTSYLNTSTLISFQVSRSRFGYSYFFTGRTRGLAARIRLAHVLLALTHTALIAWGGWLGLSFRTLRGVLALVIDSSPAPYLQNICAGTDLSDTYELVDVRIVEEGNDLLELVVGKTGGSAGVDPINEKLY